MTGTGAARGQPAAGLRDHAIDAAHSRRLLRSVRYAHVAFVDDGPRVVVMNHLADGSDLLLMTSDDTRLARLTRDDRRLAVAVAVDSVSSSGRFGWSVVARGWAARDDDAPAHPRPAPFRGGRLDVLLRVHVDELGGIEVDPGPLRTGAD